MLCRARSTSRGAKLATAADRAVPRLGRSQVARSWRAIDTVLDSGLFHVFDDEDRGRFLASLHAVMAAGSRYYLLCFSDRQPGTSGPRRVSQSEIREAFAPQEWRVDAIDAVTMETNLDAVGVHAWRASIIHL